MRHRRRSYDQKHVWRAKTILATADGCGTVEMMRRSGKSKTGGVAMLPSTYPHVQALTALATSIAARGP
jgi:hypothetical protein